MLVKANTERNGQKEKGKGKKKKKNLQRAHHCRHSASHLDDIGHGDAMLRPLVVPDADLANNLLETVVERAVHLLGRQGNRTISTAAGAGELGLSSRIVEAQTNSGAGRRWCSIPRGRGTDASSRRQCTTTRSTCPGRRQTSAAAARQSRSRPTRPARSPG